MKPIPQEMIFSPQIYSIEDKPGLPFIDKGEIERLLCNTAEPSKEQLDEIISRALSGKRLSMEETAVLIRARDPQSRAKILAAAGQLKNRIYGNRIVLFAPLYVGNKCINNCLYCGFRAENRQAVRKTLSPGELDAEVRALERAGHKRLILVFGEHPSYDARFIARSVKQAYSIRENGSEIRRININAAPLDIEGFRTVKEAGIGTYQIFQETYDPQIYTANHPSGPKSDFDFRLTAMDRAMEAGIDDVGLGVLLGLGDWRYELLALIRHTNHLEACYGVGPHTISFPRIKAASGTLSGGVAGVSDDDFISMVAILRLAVPYTGLILTAREEPELRDKLIRYGISQIDAGTQIELGGYSTPSPEQRLEREQFKIGDTRSLAEMMETLIDSGMVPSFCTSCYRKGRTGEHFMSFSTTGFIKRFCTPNALITLAEYLEDHAPPELRAKGWALIENELGRLPEKEDIERRLDEVCKGKRDLLL